MQAGIRIVGTPVDRTMLRHVIPRGGAHSRQILPASYYSLVTSCSGARG
jgi:hypothetical protein